MARQPIPQPRYDDGNGYTYNWVPQDDVLQDVSWWPAGQEGTAYQSINSGFVECNFCHAIIRQATHSDHTSWHKKYIPLLGLVGS